MNPHLFRFFSHFPLIFLQFTDTFLYVDYKTPNEPKTCFWKPQGLNDELNSTVTPPIDLHWFFEISIRAEKKFQWELKKKIS